MPISMFVNLPVSDVARSTEFVKALGFEVNPQFSDEKATCVVISETNYVMLLHNDFFKTFILHEICDASKYTEVIVCLMLESREAVDEMVKKAVAAGGTNYKEPEDYGFMYQHGFRDPDGHFWEVGYMAAPPTE